MSLYTFLSLLLVTLHSSEDFKAHPHWRSREHILKDLQSGKWNKIVNGVPTQNSDYPYIGSLHMVATRKGDATYEFSHMCGSSLIDINGDTPLVLCAAHCLYGMQQDMYDYEDEFATMYGGDWTFNLAVDIGRTRVKGDENYGESYQTIEVDDWYYHQDYDPEKTSNDVSIISLVEAIDFSLAPNAATVTWDTQTSLNNGDFLRVIGYGTNESGGALSPTLEYANLTYVNQSICNDYQNLYWYVNQTLEIGWENYDWANPDFSVLKGTPYNYQYILDGMICGWNIDADSCQGDSGGPLVNSPSSSAQVGVVSWGFYCAHGIPGIYTDVNYYRAWIRDASDCLQGVGCSSFYNTYGKSDGRYEGTSGNDDSDNNNSSSNIGTIIGIIVGVIVFAIIIGAILHWMKRRRHHGDKNYGLMNEHHHETHHHEEHHGHHEHHGHDHHDHH